MHPPQQTLISGTVDHDESLDADDLESLLGSAVTASPTDIQIHASPRVANPLGNLHGGMSLCISAWAASRALSPGGRSSITTHYVRAVAPGATVTTTPTVVHDDRFTGLARVVSAAADGRPCTLTTVTRH